MSFFHCGTGTNKGGALTGDELTTKRGAIKSQEDIDREAALAPASTPDVSVAASSAVKAAYQMPGLCDRTLSEVNDKFAETTDVWKHGLEELKITPRVFALDTLDRQDGEAYRANALAKLQEMNGPQASFQQAYQPDYKEAHDRFYTAFPLEVQAHSKDEDLQHVRLEFPLPIESRTQEDVYNLVSKVNKAGGAEFSHGNALYLYMDPHAIQTQLRESLGELNDARRYHAVVLSATALDVSNSTDTTFRVRLETANMQHTEGKPRYVPLCDPIGVCGLTDTQAHAHRNGRSGGTDGESAGQCALTLKAKAEGAIHPALRTMFKISPQGIARLNSPDLTRWAQVDPRKARAEAGQFRFLDGPNLHFAEQEDQNSETVLLPGTIAEYIFYAHGYELRQACELLEQRRLAGVQVAGISPADPIDPPHVREVGTVNGSNFWIVPFAAFEMVLDFYCNLACQSDSAANLAVPLRLALTPASGNAGWKNMLVNHQRDVEQKRVRPVHIRVFVDVVYARIAGGCLLTPEDKERLVQPLVRNKLQADLAADQVQNQVADYSDYFDGKNTPKTAGRSSVTGKYTR